MKLAIFDLDNTLLAGDSDYLWGRFLVERGIVDAHHYQRENERFYGEYKKGTLDIYEYQRFSLAPLVGQDKVILDQWHHEFMEEKIKPIITDESRTLLETHRAQGDYLLIITATNRFITAPIAKELGVDDLLATDPELKEGYYTGSLIGTPCFQNGKVVRLEQWLVETGFNLAGASFYSDSHNDLPLLERVERPVAVDPDSTLENHARARGWPIISLRGAEVAEAELTE